MNKVCVTVITTGGTIDKDYGTGIGVRDLHIGPPFAKTYLPRKFPEIVFHFVELCAKDSLDMRPRDREQVAEACRRANTRRIIVTHGTDTMLKTAEQVRRSGIARRRTIVMTGALRPACMKVTDAKVNLDLAVKAALAGETGVLIAMNEVVHDSRACKKDPVTGQFVPKAPIKTVADPLDRQGYL